MKLILILISFSALSSAFSQTYYQKLDSLEDCQYRLDNIEELFDGTIRYRKAILSPDAKKILLLGKNDTQIVDVETKDVIRRFDYYYDGQWVNDTVIMFRVSKDIELKSIYPGIPVPRISVPKLEFSNKHRVVRANYKGKSRIIADHSNKDRRVLFDFVYSNDFSKVIIRSNSGRSFIYNIDGTGLVGNIKFGSPYDWSDDNSKILSSLGLDHGEHYIVESDLYIYNIETSKTCKLTDSEDLLEFRPSWSKNKVTFINEKDEKIYIADIVKRH